ncbi:hypothetical protein [Bradyrhizobium yuanmingense]|uniref:hypothetical protein n=1 Tax=Bradyrhizobium yuanmingense TaxID=108015 RepID=UPI0023B94638|nr:hypothetical protein [Bradyrhizobium yuanmingense]MDF0585040.1 hypothetical protein [Bradyrhizobium yuanmingense]
MKAILFCNIGWMSRYEGLAGKPDKIVGGGKFVAENETGLEVCNFLSCRDGYTYGHVETIQGEKDRQIQIEAFGGAGEYADEVEISSRHDKLQGSFERYLARAGATQVTPNVASVDLRYNDATRGLTLVEIKPCDKASARYAIRTAIGQLLDYRQRANADVSLLIVLETAPSNEDRSLATQNGFGVAYPLRGTFEFLWPTPS